MWTTVRQRPEGHRPRRLGVSSSKVEEVPHHLTDLRQVVVADSAQSALEAARIDGAHVFRASEAGLTQARVESVDPWPGHQAAIVTGERNHHDHVDRKCMKSVRRHHHDGPATALLLSDRWIEFGQPDLAGADVSHSHQPDSSSVASVSRSVPACHDRDSARSAAQASGSSWRSFSSCSGNHGTPYAEGVEDLGALVGVDGCGEFQCGVDRVTLGRARCARASSSSSISMIVRAMHLRTSMMKASTAAACRVALRVADPAGEAWLAGHLAQVIDPGAATQMADCPVTLTISSKS